MLKSCLIFLATFFLLVSITSHKTYAVYSLQGSSTATGSASVAMPISDVQITGTGAEPISVKLLVTSGTLAMSTVTGLTFTGGQTGSTLYFSGTLTNINNALATLTYTRGSTGTDTLEISLVEPGEVFFTGNNHLYKFISGSINANNALTAAAGQTAYGATGYLATITSQAENDFVAARLQGDGWMGASDASVEGDWRWITGPEAGTSFWLGVANGATVGGNYANWAPGEPNQAGNEDCGQFYISSSRWNDLPCTGANLAGYIVEFGAPGNMPTVVAKNVSITTVTNPTLSSTTPSDNATSVAITTNLVMNFSKTVLKGTGNILIKKSSDDTTVETIDVTSSAVSGANSSTITIDPSVTLTEGTGYYVTIPNTAFRDSLNNYFAGIASSSTWNFTTGDFTGPSVSAVEAGSLTASGATITWTTNENASTKVSYGLTSALGSDTATTDTSPRVTSHSVTLSGLLACTTYYYQAVSIDGSSNSATSTTAPFTTIGCTTSTPPASTQAETITVSSGGTTNLSESDSAISVETPANFTDDASSVVIQIQAIPNTSVLASLGKPASLPNEVGDIVFDVKAIINATTVLDSFDAPVTITYQYTDQDISGIDEASLWLYHYHNGSWQALSDCTVTPASNTISCTTQSFSIFGLFGKVPTASASTGSASTSSCRTIDMTITPDLFQIDATAGQAKLYFSPLAKDVDNYLITYGYTSGEERFATFTGQGASTGVLSYTINDLDTNMTYYFRVRPKNDCSVGNWSNEMKITTTKSENAEVKYYKNFISRVASLLPRKTTDTGSSTPHVKSKRPSKAQGCTTYTVQPNDTLWDIASSQLGRGSRFEEIMKANNLSSPALKPGQSLKVGC